MSESKRQAKAMSVRQLLLNKSRESRISFDSLVQRYAIERLLFRLQRSRFAEAFVLKGAMVFLTWGIELPRPTRDLDLMGFVKPEPEGIAEIFREVALVEVEEDGLNFESDAVSAEQIKEEDLHAGVRVKMLSKLGTMRIKLQVDIGVGDSLIPKPEEAIFPAIIGNEPPRLLAYTPYLVVAEKYEAMIKLGEKNTRMKDFFDIWFLAMNFNFAEQELRQSVVHTFRRRSSPIPAERPLPLSNFFAGSAAKVQQWEAFLKKLELGSISTTLEQTVELIWQFLGVVSFPASESGLTWRPGGPWTKP